MTTPPLPDRQAVPFQIKGVAAFSKHRGLTSGVAIARLLRANPAIWQPLRDAVAQAAPAGGRPRAAGCWEIAYLAFVASRIACVQPWYDAVLDNPTFWAACEIEGPPSYWTVWRRFAELEQLESAFEDTVARLVRVARQHEPAIGAWLHVDATESETHGQLRHDCRPGGACALFCVSRVVV